MVEAGLRTCTPDPLVGRAWHPRAVTNSVDHVDDDPQPRRMQGRATDAAMTGRRLGFSPRLKTIDGVMGAHQLPPRSLLSGTRALSSNQATGRHEANYDTTDAAEYIQTAFAHRFWK